MITNLRILFEDKKIRIPNNEKMIAQLHALERKPSGPNVRWEPGKTTRFGTHDDYVWSLAMGVQGKRTRGTSEFYVGGQRKQGEFFDENRGIEQEFFRKNKI